MSPELFDPEEFDLEDDRPTKSSDCYALGMVIYEVLSGQKPFFGCGRYVVIAKVLNGKRPVRPQGVDGRWFTDDVWNISERCWSGSPGERPRVEDVLRCLKVQLPQEDLKREDILGDNVDAVRVDNVSPAPAPIAVCYFVVMPLLSPS